MCQCVFLKIFCSHTVKKEHVRNFPNLCMNIILMKIKKNSNISLNSS
jgi:hypothetical protein